MGFRRLALGLVLVAGVMPAQKPRKGGDRSGYDRAARATVLHVANVYASADTDAPPIVTVSPGHEVVVILSGGNLEPELRAELVAE